MNSERIEPTLRHEFAGMMFALTIGEVGLQAAALVKAGHNQAAYVAEADKGDP